ncbi:MAG: hypothetical protein ISS36_02490 [Candidatus Aenigmarchaeota archaeon]|nr:hypothetical protein [Candidatus Aenigmarchaeota archaeon]
MILHNFGEEPVFERDGLKITRYSADPQRIQKTSANYGTFIYVSGPANLWTGDYKCSLPEKGVFGIVKSDQEYVFQARNDSDLYVFDVFDMAEAAKISEFPVIDMREWSDEMWISSDGSVVMYPDSSRVLPDGGRSGWFTHAYKGTHIGIADAEWEEIRENEDLHYHKFTAEGRITLEGGMKVACAGQVIDVPREHMLVLDPKSGAQRIVEIETPHRHVAWSWPSYPEDPNLEPDKIEIK